MTIIRERHAFEGQTLAVISSIKRRGVLLVLVILPNGSRSLISASWTNWRDPHNTKTSSNADDVIHAPALGKFGDLLHLRKIIDALRRRHIESASHVESSNAAEPLSRRFRSAVKPQSSSPPQDAWDQVDETARIAALQLLTRLIARVSAHAEIRWVEASYHAIHQVLTNPVYAEPTSMGKTRTEITLDAAGVRRKRIRLLPRDHWQVLIKEHHS